MEKRNKTEVSIKKERCISNNKRHLPEDSLKKLLSANQMKKNTLGEYALRKIPCGYCCEENNIPLSAALCKIMT